MSIDLNNINKGNGVGAEKTANNANSRVNALAGFGQDYGQQEARLALALADAGLGGGGGGGGLTQAQAQAAFTAALESQNQVEFQEILLQDSTGTVFISSRLINEETGAITISTRLLDGNNYTPISPITKPIEPIQYTRKYRALFSDPGVNLGDILVQYISASNTINWTNERTGLIISSPSGEIISVDKALTGQQVQSFVNSTLSTFQMKLTNTLLKSIYIDNLAPGVIYLQIFQGLSAAPNTGAIPQECYRIPSNGSISLELDRVYSSQMYIGISSTIGTFTASAQLKNLVVGYE